MGLWSRIDGWVDLHFEHLHKRTEIERPDGTVKINDEYYYMQEGDVKRIVYGLMMYHNVLFRSNVHELTRILINGDSLHPDLGQNLYSYMTTDKQNVSIDARIQHSIFPIHIDREQIFEDFEYESGDEDHNMHHFPHCTDFRLNLFSVNRYWTIDEHWKWFKTFLRDMKKRGFKVTGYGLNFYGVREDKTKKSVNMFVGKDINGNITKTDYRYGNE